MKIENILEVEQEIKRFLKRLRDLKESEINDDRFNLFEKTSQPQLTYTCKESGALKRSSMDLTRSLSKMRNDVW
jgi:hypothetical protein